MIGDDSPISVSETCNVIPSMADGGRRLKETSVLISQLDPPNGVYLLPVVSFSLKKMGNV
jgi:hypothetical protein